nr:DedA family protein [Geobacillus subterraneus]
MDTSVWLPYVQSYGYVMLFLFLFCGIVGIPAPEESLLFFVGVVVAKEQLLLWPTLASCWGGTMAGMVAAYGAGRWWGAPFVQKYGKYVGITGERWERARDWFRRYGKWGHFVRLLCPGSAANLSVYGGGEPIPVSDICFVRYGWDSGLGRSADIGRAIARPSYPCPPHFLSACRIGVVFALFACGVDWAAEAKKIF